MLNLQRSISKPAPGAKLPVKPSVIHTALDLKLSGVDEAKRFISTRIALHLRRALDLATGKAVPDKNQCLLIMGPSGSGKTFLIEQAAAIARIPFVATSAASLTSEGYTGQNLSSVFHQIKAAATNAKVAQYGICFLDEWDKRVQSINEKSVFSQGIQGEILRMMEGTVVELESRQRQNKPAIKFDTKGLMFVFAGAFEGLDRLMENQTGRKVSGFAPEGAASFRLSRDNGLREALVAYGMLPEFINRLSGILTIPAPTHDDMRALIMFRNGPVEICNQRLRGLGAELVLAEPAAQALADYACKTKTYCRGMQLVLQAAMDHLVYEGFEGQIALEPRDIRQLAEGNRPVMASLPPHEKQMATGRDAPLFMTAA